jgi:hypothetical protein
MVTPTIKIHHLHLSVDRSIRIVQQFKQVFEPHLMIFKELKGKKKQLPSQCFCKEKKNSKKY